ncbi:MAG TPA: hypothetical protein VKS79_00145, partial [Gemmataceae bacterium]|nr:hypothetical protein [Gemmataceae bacterium]
MHRFRKYLWPAAGGIVIVSLLVYAFSPARVEVDTAKVDRGPLIVTVDHEGKTRVKERYVVSAPLAGRMLRVDLHPGDRVEENQTVLAIIEPADPSLLDARSRAEAESRVRAAEEAIKLAETNRNQAQAEADRLRRLKGTQAVSETEMERAEFRERATAFSLRIAQFELELAR